MTVNRDMVIKEDFYYYAVVRSIYDGDTIRADIDLGFDVWINNVAIRLKGIDTPEIRGEERTDGLISKDWLVKKIPVGTKIIIQSYKHETGKYGRYLLHLWLDGVNLNEQLVELGLAEVYME